jgi:hypothetical protein
MCYDQKEFENHCPIPLASHQKTGTWTHAQNATFEVLMIGEDSS